MASIVPMPGCPKFPRCSPQRKLLFCNMVGYSATLALVFLGVMLSIIHEVDLKPLGGR